MSTIELAAQYRANAKFYRDYGKRFREGSQGRIGNNAEADKYESMASHMEAIKPVEARKNLCPSCKSDDPRYRFGTPCFDQWHGIYLPEDQYESPSLPPVEEARS